MKTRIRQLFLLPALTAGFALILASAVTAQTFTVLHTFNSTPDGEEPYAGLILAANTLYGTAANGGSIGEGTVFKVNTDGTGFMNLHSFNFSRAGSPQWPEHRDQSHLRHSAVLPVKPVVVQRC